MTTFLRIVEDGQINYLNADTIGRVEAEGEDLIFHIIDNDTFCTPKTKKLIYQLEQLVPDSRPHTNTGPK